MMRAIPIGQKKQKTSLVSGLQWLRSSGWALADLLSQNDNSEAYIALASGDLEMVGVLARAPKGRAYSIAALASRYALARNVPNAAFLLDIGRSVEGEEGFLFVGLLDGLPVPGYDQAGSLEQVTVLFDKFRADAVDMELVLFSDIEDGAGLRFPGSSPATLSDILPAAGEEGAALIRSAPGSPMPRVLAVVAIVLAGSYFGWQWWQDHLRAEQEAIARANQKTPEQLYAEALANSSASAGWAIPDALKAINVAGHADLQRGGWKAIRIACRSEDNGCSVAWQPASLAATYATLAATTNGGLERISIEQGRVIERIPVSGLKPLPPIVLATLPPQAEFMTGIVSRLQHLAATGDLQFTLSGADPWPPGAPKVALSASKGRISVSGSLWLLPMLSTLDARHVSISSIEASPEGFKVDINYFFVRQASAS